MDKKECRLEIKHVTHSYSNKKGAQKALDNVSLSLGCGLYGLLGPNGAGKSTLINIITGNMLASKGGVLWNGKKSLVLGKKYRSILGYMPQQQTLYDGFTGRQFLLYLAALKEIPSCEARAETERVVAIVHLEQELDKFLSAYSGGMKQRLLAASAMMGCPKLLIMDEPTAGLDPKERVHLRETLAALSKERIVLVATHVVSDVESVADGIILLKQGRIVDIASAKSLTEKYAPDGGLEDVYLAVFGEDGG